VIDLIKAEMRKRRMTQQELAGLAGLSEPCIFRLLAGKSKPKYETVQRVLHSLGYELRTRKRRRRLSNPG
jgi:predicted transcriptional regulator